MLRGGPNLCTTGAESTAHTIGHDLAHRKLTFVHKCRVGVAASDSEPEDPLRAFRDASISKVEAEEIRIRAAWYFFRGTPAHRAVNRPEWCAISTTLSADPRAD